MVFYPQLLSAVGVTSSFAISLYLAANGVAGGVSAVMYDRLLRRTECATLVVVAFIFWLLGFGAAIVVETAVGALLPIILFGLGVGLVFPSTFAWIERIAPSDRQGQFNAYIASFGYTGQFLSPVLFGPLVPLMGVRGVFMAAATLAGLSLFVFGVGRFQTHA